ncbi:PilZ domain-containing protein [Methylobacterium radiodurans]|uniref:PilZ domain-containing protein n=1 Tax=Methylobacterium radiodurans TaxID=2202828 RepID=A0A2U8VUR5_9HYPH|nr:PilZ domain-containing protein [Methylobacterium radiodurans]AWN36876.1 hypothetical protein DK427_14985 [Methylobacterium radiodurans]
MRRAVWSPAFRTGPERRRRPAPDVPSMSSAETGDARDPAGQGRRGAPRVPALIPASALLPDGTVQVCVIRDISTGGARLSIARRHSLAETFRLQVARFEHPFRVRRVWQHGDFAGVMLEVGQGADLTSPSPPARRPSGAAR